MSDILRSVSLNSRLPSVRQRCGPLLTSDSFGSLRVFTEHFQATLSDHAPRGLPGLRPSFCVGHGPIAHEMYGSGSVATVNQDTPPPWCRRRIHRPAASLQPTRAGGSSAAFIGRNDRAYHARVVHITPSGAVHPLSPHASAIVVCSQRRWIWE